MSKQPLVFKNKSEITPEAVRSIPMIGHEKIAGWTFIRYYFVDSSGFGQEGESALTFGQFMAQIKPSYGYGIVDAGQFQVNIGMWKKK